MDLFTLSFILLTHFIADFVLQSNWMKQNKSTSNKALGAHVVVYTIPFMLLISPLYGLVNGILHFCIDYVASRRTSVLWKQGRVHDFFIVIGFDQLLHVLSLIWTYKLLIG